MDRRDDARRFLAGDYLFILLYAVLSPIALWRFGSALRGTAARWVKLGAVLLACAGVIDATENALLLSATGSVSKGAVDAAHGLAIPKTTLFLAGALLAVAANVRAIVALRA